MDDDTTSLCAALFGLAGFEILAAADAGGELELLVQTTADLVGCPSCGAVARAKDRRPTWVRRRLAIGPGVEAVFPDSLGGWRDPSNVRRIWRQVRETLELDGLVTHTLRKTVATFLDDADVSTRRISDQLGHAKVSMTQDRYLGRRLTDRQTAEVLERLFEIPGDINGPKMVL